LKIKDDSDSVTGQHSKAQFLFIGWAATQVDGKNLQMLVHLFYSAFGRTKTELSLTQIFPSNIAMKT
jgi:hypothetical protein